MPTANDILLDWSISHAVYLQRYGAGVVQKIIGLLNRADTDIIRLIQSQDPEIDRARLEQMVEQIRALNATIVSRMADTLSAELQDLAAAEIASQTEALSEAMPAAVRANLAIVAPAPIQVWAAATANPMQGRYLREWYQSLESSRQARLRDAIRIGFVEGESIDQLVRRVRGTRAAQYKDGVMEISRRDAAAVVRTAVNHVSNVARQETYRQNDSVVKKWQFLATLDGRTTLTCASLNLKTFPVGEGPQPPRHVNCRSTSTPVLSAASGIPGVDWRRLPKATRSSMDGQVAADISFSDWLRGKPRDFIEDYLGPTRAKLFIEGRLTVDKFVDRRGNELTLDQIRQREREAWKRAGLSEAA